MQDIPIFEITSAVRDHHPGTRAGVLVMERVTNPAEHPGLENRKAALLEDLRRRFSGQTRGSLRQTPALAAYHAYYKAFKKTYHVQHQLESVVFKNRGLPSVAALVEAMFMAELKHQLLTAGHDFDTVEPPIRLSVADGSETYLRLNEQEQTLKQGDLYMADQKGVLSSILYGPDFRTRINAATRRAVFTVYVPTGIEAAAVESHLQDIADFASVISSQARVLQRAVY